MKLHPNSKRYKALIQNLKKATAARSRKAKAKSGFPSFVGRFEPITTTPTMLDRLRAKRDRMSAAIEVLEEMGE